MKKANNNEMDLILRGFAKSRRDDSSLDIDASFGDNNGEISKHLDADELNSFAEGLVPEPARARYIGHLADCSNCRRLVVNLTQASGSLSPSPVSDKQSGSGFWQRMAAVFSPSVLRYAVPALALTAVIAIGLLALRQQRNQEFIAQQQPETRETYSAQPQTTEQPLATSGKETSLAPQASVESKPIKDAKERVNAQSVQGEIAKAQADTGLMQAAPTSKDGVPAPPPAALEPTVSRTQPFFSPEPKAGSYNSGRPVLSDVKRAETSKEEQPADRMAEPRERDESNFKFGKKNEDERAGSDVAAASGPRRAEAPMSARRAPLKSKKDSDAEETRSVSGRRFRRQGNVWVDSSYESSHATINVTRGSEQFRALVADEPGLRAIANQLGGEVIVVWKGKAYRIH
jgi:hypothetical protein